MVRHYYKFFKVVSIQSYSFLIMEPKSIGFGQLYDYSIILLYISSEAGLMSLIKEAKKWVITTLSLHFLRLLLFPLNKTYVTIKT